jgi:hypothetical protein
LNLGDFCHKCLCFDLEVENKSRNNFFCHCKNLQTLREILQYSFVKNVNDISQIRYCFKYKVPAKILKISFLDWMHSS